MVNLYTSKIKVTGRRVETPQYEIDLRFDWKARDEDKSYSENVLFPDFLITMSQEWLNEHISELMIASLRVKAQVDSATDAVSTKFSYAEAGDTDKPKLSTRIVISIRKFLRATIESTIRLLVKLEARI